ncbi:hypothetical protein OWV82_009327 [Melia azedarach]|uniref:Uncharacterized protein n=2 Tax=Melia azedarach TaxID=155640 RepID=A0ACC1YDT6_MELAZ|nr:hypothetical protein OWV82_009327 [Melia azedarach]
MMQKVSETFNNFRILVRKMQKMILETFKKFDNWKKCACIFYSLAWISWSVASLSISSLILSFWLIFLVFPALLSGLYILQSLMFFFIIQSPVTQLIIGNAGFGVVHEIMYQELEGNSLLMLAFAFQQTGLILQYRYYSGFSNGTFPVDFWEQGKILLKVFIMHLIQTMTRSFFHGCYVEAGALLVPILVGSFAILYRGDLSLQFVNGESLVNKIQIQSPEGNVSAELDSLGHKADKLKEKKEVVEKEEGEVLQEEEEEEEEKVVEKEEGQVLQEEQEEEEEVEEAMVVEKEEVEEVMVVEKKEGQVLQEKEEVKEKNVVEKEEEEEKKVVEKEEEEEKKVVEKEEGEVLQEEEEEEEEKVVEKEEGEVLQEEEEEEEEEEKVVEKEEGQVLQEEEEEEVEDAMVVEKKEGQVLQEKEEVKEKNVVEKEEEEEEEKKVVEKEEGEVLPEEEEKVVDKEEGEVMEEEEEVGEGEEEEGGGKVVEEAEEEKEVKKEVIKEEGKVVEDDYVLV